MATKEQLEKLWDHMDKGQKFMNDYDIIDTNHTDPDFTSFKNLYTFLKKSKKVNLHYTAYSSMMKHLLDKDGKVDMTKAGKKALASNFNKLNSAIDEIIKDKKKFFWSEDHEQYLPEAEKSEFVISQEDLIKISGVYVGFFNLENKTMKRFVFSISTHNSVILRSEYADSEGSCGLEGRMLWFILYSKKSKTPELIVADIRHKLQNQSKLDSFTAMSTWFDPVSGSPVSAASYLKRVHDKPITGNAKLSDYFNIITPSEAEEIECKLKTLGDSYIKLEKPDL